MNTIEQVTSSRRKFSSFFIERTANGMNEPTLTSIHNYRALDESLCTSGQPSVAQLREIAEAGFTAVINLALHDDPRYSLPDERGVVQSLGMTYVHIPVQFSAPTHADLLEFFAAMEAHEGEKVWIHCAANMRVSAFLGLYRVIKQGWDRERAFALMDDLWQPNEVWSSFIASMLQRQRADLLPSRGFFPARFAFHRHASGLAVLITGLCMPETGGRMMVRGQARGTPP